MRWLLRHERVAAAVVLALAVLVYLAPLLAGRRMGHGYLLFDYVPWHAAHPGGIGLGGAEPNLDIALESLPLTELARHQLAHGWLPLWNPSSYAGTPLLADMQSGLLYPPNWLALVLPFTVAIGWICAIKLFTAGLGTYLFARELRIRPGPSLAAALVYMFSGPVIAFAEVPLGAAVTLLPWLMLATERVRRAPSAGSVAAVAAAVAVSVFGGHPETTALSSAAAAIYLAFALAAERRQREAARRRIRAALGWLGGHVLGVGCAAVLVLPFAGALAGSVSAQYHSGHAALHLPLSSALVLFLPNVFGEGSDYRGPLAFYLVSAGYFGVAAMALGAVGAWRNRAAPFAWGLLAAGLIALMVIFAVPPVSWIVPHLPPFSHALNVRTFYVPALAGAVLAGAGLDSLLARRLAPRRIALAVGGLCAIAGVWYLVQHLRGALTGDAASERGAVLKFVVFAALGAVVLAIAGRVRARYAVVATALVLVADLAYLHDFNPLLPAAQAQPAKPPVVSFLQRRPGAFRIGPVKPTATARAVFPPNSPALYGLEAPQGYDYPQSARWYRFAERVLGEKGVPTPEFPALAYARPTGPARTGLQLMNVRYYVAAPGTPPPGPGLARVYSASDATVYEDRAALPRAFLVGATQRVSDRAALATLARGGLDPRRLALVPRDAPRVSARGPAYTPLRARRIDPGHWRITLPRRGTPGAWLVLGNAYRDDWGARVDGREVRLYPADYAAMGLPVPPGARTVDVELDRSPYNVGAVVSVLSLLATLALGLFPWLRARRRATTAGPPPRAAPG